jgi:hypothetical protein
LPPNKINVQYFRPTAFPVASAFDNHPQGIQFLSRISEADSRNNVHMELTIKFQKRRRSCCWIHWGAFGCGRQLLWRGRRRVSLTGKKSQVEDSLSGQPHPPRRLLHRPQAVALRNDTVTIFSIYTRNMWMRGRAYILLYLQIAQRNLRQQLSSHVHVCTSRKRSESRANNQGCGHVRRIHNKKREKACYTDGK